MFSLVCDLVFRFASGEHIWHLMAGTPWSLVSSVPWQRPFPD